MVTGQSCHLAEQETALWLFLNKGAGTGAGLAVRR